MKNILATEYFEFRKHKKKYYLVKFFMKYLFIFFFVILNMFCLVNSFLISACLTFENRDNDTGNSCWSHSYASTIENRRHGSNCLKCEIKDINTATKNTCRRTHQCLSFIFYNNSFFEQFFYKHPSIIDHILTDPRKGEVLNRLIITIQNYDLTKITFQYLNSILNMNSSSYHLLHVIFIKPISDRELIQVKNDFSHIPIKIIYLSFSCNYHMDDEHWLEFVIHPRSTHPEKIKSCPSTRLKSTISIIIQTIQIVRTSTAQMINITSNTTIKNKSSVLRKSDTLLFDLLLFFAILIGVIIILFYIFFQYRCRKKPQDLNMRSSIDTFNTADTNGKSSDNSSLKSERISSPPDKRTVKFNKRIIYKFQDD